MNPAARGALAGLAATLPMTAAMKWMHERLPREERYPLPPREVTLEVADRAGIGANLDSEPKQKGATVAAHFAYGAVAGALYAPFAASRLGSPAVTGALFGVSLWAASYLGWLPAAGIRPSSLKQPARREGLMIAAHLVWGASLGMLEAALSRPRP